MTTLKIRCSSSCMQRHASNHLGFANIRLNSGARPLPRPAASSNVLTLAGFETWGRKKEFNGGVTGEVVSWPGTGIAQWLERRTRDWKVPGSNPCRSGGRIFFSRVDFLCWLWFRYPFHPRVTAVARKRSRSFCQKRRWQVTAKHAYTLCMWLCMKWHGAWLYGVHRTCAEMAAVSCGTSPASAVSTPLRWIFKKRAIRS